jgi:CHASE3 domain sensor protein
MNKKVILIFLAGWLLSLVVSPVMLLGVVKSVTNRSN